MEHKTVVVNGLASHYQVAGAGPDVIFVHGWASSRRMWNGLWGHLASQYRCWALDLPGCGDSEKPTPGWYSIPHFSAYVLEFARLQGIERLRLVGHSMGGMIALDLAGRYPESVERLVAINPVVTGRANLRPLAHPGLTRSLLGWVLKLSPLVMQPLLAYSLGSRVGRVQPIQRRFHPIQRRAEEFNKGTVDSLIFSGRAVVDHDVSPLLERITAPALVLLGDQDANVPASEGRHAARRIPNGQLHIMRAGHMVTDDRPADVAHLLAGFLA